MEQNNTLAQNALLASLSAAAEMAWAAYYARRTSAAYQVAFRATYAHDAAHARLQHGYCRP